MGSFPLDSEYSTELSAEGREMYRYSVMHCRMLAHTVDWNVCGIMSYIILLTIYCTFANSLHSLITRSFALQNMSIDSITIYGRQTLFCPVRHGGQDLCAQSYQGSIFIYLFMLVLSVSIAKALRVCWLLFYSGM